MLVCLVSFLTWWYTSEKWPRSRKTWLGTSWLGSTQWVSSTAVFSSNTFKNICKMARMSYGMDLGFWIFDLGCLFLNFGAPNVWLSSASTWGTKSTHTLQRRLRENPRGWCSSQCAKCSPQRCGTEDFFVACAPLPTIIHVNKALAKLLPQFFSLLIDFHPKKLNCLDFAFLFSLWYFDIFCSLCWWICKNIFVQLFWGDWP